VKDLDHIPKMKLMDHVAGIVLNVEPHVERQPSLTHLAGQHIPCGHQCPFARGREFRELDPFDVADELLTVPKMEMKPCHSYAPQRPLSGTSSLTYIEYNVTDRPTY